MKKGLRRMISLVLACLILLQLPVMGAPVRAEEVSAQEADTLFDTVDFSVTGSNVCTHETGDYHLRYDPEQGQMIFEEVEDFSPNGAQKHDYQADSQVKTYFELDRAMRLEYDRPWVMEYTVTDPGKFVFTDVDSEGTAHPYFLNDDRNYLFVPIMQEIASGEYQTGYYGIDLREKFIYNTADSYTLKLENVIDGDGSNMIYLTVYNNTIQETVLQPTAMDDYYLIVNSSYVLQDSESKVISGRDFVIRYICNKSYNFDSPSLEMKVWENGVDGGNSDYFTDQVTKPTCASEGYTTRTCSLCGYSYDSDFVEPLDHQFGEWTESREPSCSAAGEEQRICAVCGHAETRETVFAEHNYVSAVVPSTCVEQGYTLHTCSACGHSYTDTFVETAAHAMGQWEITQEATCAAEGEKRSDCANCDYFETEKIEKTAHTYEAVVTAPTCTEKGYTTHICSCGDSYVDSYVDAGHTVVTLPAKTPTATENGLTEGEGCSGCGEVYVAQQVIPAIGSALPAGYQRVNYLESIGEAYIDTGLAALPGDKLILYSAATSNATMSMMGSGSSNTSNDRVQAHYVLYRGYTLRFFGQLCDYVTIPMGRMTTFLFDLEKGMGYIDGKLVLEQQPEVLPSDDNIYLFAKNANGKADWEFAGSCRIYGYKHYRNGALVRDMIPCCRESDGVYGLYDLVNGKFYTKSGEGSLVYEPLELIGEAGIVMNMDTGEVYYSKNVHWRNTMASLTKIMTCILALENLDLNARTVPAIESDLLPLGSNMGLVLGESLTVQDALYGLILPSGCDAAQLLARTVARDYDTFVDMMNAKAKELGMTETLFSCPSGLDDEIQYTTVTDLVKLMRYAMKNEMFCRLIGTERYQIKADDQGARDHKLVTTNGLLKAYDGCIGGKTGTTTASGAHVIEVAKRHGSTLLAMIFSSDPAERYNDITKLLDYGFTKTPEHVYDRVVTAPTCTEQGYTTHMCQCGEISHVDSYTDPLGHHLWERTLLTAPVSGQECQLRCDCVRCDYSEIRTVEHLVKLEEDDLTKQKEVWINGMPCPVIAAGQDRYVELPSAGEYLLVTYTYQNADNPDVHTQYPTGMKVYKVSGGKITHIKELDDLLRYSGSSIRIKGAKGVRMITSLAKQSKAALTGNGLAGYKLVEYGTTLCWASEIKEGDALTLDKSFARSNYAYKRGVADPIFATTDDLVQYTNVLVGFNNDQCKDDIAMRPYIILEDANGEQITLYGGIVYRSIGYIAYQNRNVVRQGTEAYKYVWEIIHHVYGSKYDADYKD